MAVVDSFYRFTFPDLEANFLVGGSRMELDSLEQIARSLNRPVTFIFLYCSLSTLPDSQGARAIPSREFTKRQLEAAMVVKDYIRCQLCANP